MRRPIHTNTFGVRASNNVLETPADCIGGNPPERSRGALWTTSRGLLRATTATVLALVCIAGVVRADDDVPRTLLREHLGEPRLRINAGGHTGTVRAMAFSTDSSMLLSAGLDKNVETWNLNAVGRNLQRVFLRQRTLRWQVARGLRGSIYAMAVAPNDGLTAVAGYGAMGSLGEILLFNPADGSLERVLHAGDRRGQPVHSLAFSADGNWLAAMELGGEATLFRRGDWHPIQLYPPDAKKFGPKKAAEIAGLSTFRPIAILGNRYVVLPYYVEKDGRAGWQLVRIGLEDTQDFTVLDVVHRDVVTALAATADGKRAASADSRGNLYLWNTVGKPRSVLLQKGRPVTSLCFSPDGLTLVAGTIRDEGESEVQLWSIAGDGTAKQTGARTAFDSIFACAVSPDGKRLAYSGGRNNSVFVDSLEGDRPATPLSGTARQVWRVAFAKEKPLYRVAFGTTPDANRFNDYGPLQESFDTTGPAMGPLAKPDPADWLSNEWLHGGWTVKRTGDGRRLQLFRGGVARGVVDLKPRQANFNEGKPRSYCWLPDARGNPFAIVVGTDVQNQIYVCRLVEQGTCPILRQFRGHHDWVTSLGVSRDLKYLVSGSTDGTMKIWCLAEIARGRAPIGAWGAEFAVRDNRLVAVTAHPAGPLFRRGLRDGDVVDKIQWMDAGKLRTENGPAEMLDALKNVPWRTQVSVESSRGGKARDPFHALPAWQPLATLFVDTNREWAFWTPAGYYDASLNGHRLFGWQVNRGVDKAPEFFRADGMYKNLERPDALRRLLEVGSLQQALARADALPREELQQVLKTQIAASPTVEIVTPQAGDVVRKNLTMVTARIKVPTACKLVSTRVSANGVVGSGYKVVAREQAADGDVLTCQWELPLPQDPKTRIRVTAETDRATSRTDDVVVRHLGPPLKSKPKLYVLAVGIDKYGDPAIQSLSYCVADADAVVDQFNRGARGLYSLEQVDVLSNEKVTPASWRQTVAKLKEKLVREAGPDDLLVFFMAGHGVLDTRNDYYFVGHGMKMADFKRPEFAGEDCLSWADFRTLADLPCRKLALLDTCHSGAAQPALQPSGAGNVKTSVRTLNDAVIFTVTASTGLQRSIENKQWGHGAFTMSLLEALDGKADVPGDGRGTVTLHETIAYVKRRVPELTGGKQTPTASPAEWLRDTALAITNVAE
ncbi:MAG: caspase family protein [Candidatus Nealsonbacteria bacterium]|nr:caspase family protein [Candidatus Nealsonbacteria bacterium]